MRGVSGELDWRQDGHNYDAQLTLKLLSDTIHSQHSTGRIGPSGIEPELYSESRKGNVINRVVFQQNAVDVGAQDRLSVMMQIGSLLAGDPSRYPTGSRISVLTLGAGNSIEWTFVVGEEERLTLPAGEYRARKLTRNPRQAIDSKLEFWLAPAYGYLPVRIKQTAPSGSFAEAQLLDP